MESLARATPQELVQFVAEVRPKQPEHEPREKLSQVIALLERSEEILSRVIEECKERAKVAYHLQEALNILKESAEEQTLLFLVQELRAVLPHAYFRHVSDVLEPLSEGYYDIASIMKALSNEKDQIWQSRLQGMTLKELEETRDAFMGERLYYNDILQHEERMLAWSKDELVHAGSPVIVKKTISPPVPVNAIVNPHLRGWYAIHFSGATSNSLQSLAIPPETWLYIETRELKHFDYLMKLFITEKGPLLGAKIIASKFKGHRRVVGICDDRPVCESDLLNVVKEYYASESRKSQFSHVEIYAKISDTQPIYALNCRYASGTGKPSVTVSGKTSFIYP